MKTLKKYMYMSPETEILPLETMCVIMESPDGLANPNQDDPPNPGGGLHPAPWRY